MILKTLALTLVVYLQFSGVLGGLRGLQKVSDGVEGESKTEGCLQKTFSGGSWGAWSMKPECSSIIEQQVKRILADSGCSLPGAGNTVKDTDDAMIMASYGNSVELFIPSQKKTCRLPDTTTDRMAHTVDGLLVCGGARSSDHCVTLSEDLGSWTRSHSTTGRFCHTSVKIGSTLYLIGGKQEKTIDIIDMKAGGETKAGFPLQHGAWSSCAIKNLQADGFIVTGGFTDVPGESIDKVGSKRAHLYDLAGFVRDLPDMGVGRTSHGCGSYIRDDGSQVLMVVGGGHGKEGPSIGSSEALYGLDAPAWTLSTALPGAWKLPGMVTLDNKLYVTAGTDGRSRCSGDIYAWDDKSLAWDSVGKSSVAAECVVVGTLTMTSNIRNKCGI